MQYIRTMKRRTYEWCEARTRHLMEVDTCQCSPDVPRKIPLWYTDPYGNIPGMQHKHDRDHWSFYTEPHHTLYDDIVLYYQLSGSMRALDVMKIGQQTLNRAPAKELRDQHLGAADRCASENEPRSVPPIH